MPGLIVFFFCVRLMSLEGLFFSGERLEEGVDLGDREKLKERDL